MRKFSLSSKLLLLTTVFVMIAEVLIFLPSIANYRENWLMERLGAAQIAALAVDAAPGKKLSAKLQSELLTNAQVYAVALKRGRSRQLVLSPSIPLRIEGSYDLRTANTLTLIRDAIMLFANPNPGFVNVKGTPKFGAGQLIEIVIDEGPCRDAAIGFAFRIFWLSIIIAISTSLLVYFSLNALLVRPMMHLTHNMVEFSKNPEDQSRIMQPSSRNDEIGVAERELAKMQIQLTETLNQKSRLAALGLAISKINHDLRNMLASAQLISDRLTSIQDAKVQMFAPKLISSLDRAIRLCTNTLKYGQAPEPVPERSIFGLQELLNEVGQSLDMFDNGNVKLYLAINSEIQLNADRDKFYRVFMNLCRNSAQVLEAYETDQTKEIHIKSEWADGGELTIDVSDTGPGVPPKAKEHLFDAFRGSLRKGGTGLGLAITAELIRAHGGKIELLETPTGATFRINLPKSALST